jgi:hypothetical protein
VQVDPNPTAIRLPMATSAAGERPSLWRTKGSEKEHHGRNPNLVRLLFYRLNFLFDSFRLQADPPVIPSSPHRAVRRDLQPDVSDRILDVGGYVDLWAGSGMTSDITLLNFHPVPNDGLPPNMDTVLGDGTALTYEDKSFSIVFSNKSFPIEPHFLSPFIHFFPKGWQRRMLRNCTV